MVNLNSFIQLKKYCEAEHFKGWDPFDGLDHVVLTPRGKFKLLLHSIER